MPRKEEKEVSADGSPVTSCQTPLEKSVLFDSSVAERQPEEWDIAKKALDNGIKLLFEDYRRSRVGN